MGTYIVLMVWLFVAMVGGAGIHRQITHPNECIASGCTEHINRKNGDTTRVLP